MKIDPIAVDFLGGEPITRPSIPVVVTSAASAPAASPAVPIPPEGSRARRAYEREQRKLRREDRARRRKEKQYVGEVPTTEKMPQIFMTREGNKIPIANHWYGATLFVVLSGPSLTKLPLERLKERGVVTMAVNNAAMVVRPDLWTYVDPPEKFHSTIWQDAGILKLIPYNHLGERMRIQRPDGEFEKTRMQVGNLPNVLGYRRGANFIPHEYLTSEEINFGNSKRNLANGHPHIINVFFTIFKIAYYLGFRTVNLLGCDFRMDYGQSYAFAERKDAGACASNNHRYSMLSHCMSLLKPHFDKAGFAVYNCNRESGLKVFPYRSFEDAMSEATAATRDMRTLGWYTKSKG